MMHMKIVSLKQRKMWLAGFMIVEFGESKVFRQGATATYSKSMFQYLAPERVDHTDRSLKADV